MKVVIQRSNEASVKVKDKIVGKIDKGLVVLVGFTYGDTIKEIKYFTCTEILPFSSTISQSNITGRVYQITFKAN